MVLCGTKRGDLLHLASSFFEIRMHFACAAEKIRRLPASGCRGLSLLVGKGGTKTFRSMFKLHGAWITRTLGRFGEVKERQAGEESGDTAWAREQVRNDRVLAHQAKDPRMPKQTGPNSTFEYVVDQFIELHAKPRQRTWDQTERVLKYNCAGWLKKPIASITKQDARTLLRGFTTDGHVYKAAVTQRWLKKLWKWSYSEDLVPAQIMDGVQIDFRKRHRDRVYGDDELRSIWSAAGRLTPTDGASVTA